ncbi:hypothetical protein PH5382_00481 [Phaeobacter sp. CECT 5382]|nr:hypothetical protein PH5382_00481 [Phaeobacter sp. CECT 5382]
MTPDFLQKAIAICDDKIAKKGEGVGLSFYAFFKNRNGGSRRMSWIISKKR